MHPERAQDWDMGCSLGNDRFSGGVPFAYSTPANTALNRVTYYDHDHLGNTRLTYTPSECKDVAPTDGVPEWTLLIEHAVDYDPYGSILRQHIHSAQEKYLTTHHERDLETGLDYRGARYYDSDVARFLSLDPAQAEYPSWSAYNYVLGNPIYFTDPDGRRADGYVDENGNYLGDDGSTTSHETRVISKDKWNELTARGEYCDNGAINQGGRERLQSESLLLSDWHHSIDINQGTWDRLVANGGRELVPWLNNMSSHTAYF